MKAGLFHPRCRDSASPYFEGVNTPPDREVLPAKAREELSELERAENKAAYAERMEKMYRRLGRYALDPDNRSLYLSRADRWSEQAEKWRSYHEKQLAKAVESGIIIAEPLSRFLNSSESIFRYAKKVKPIDGYEDCFVHGDKNGFSIKDKNGNDHDYYTPREFADVIRSDPNYHGGNIRLFSCESGAEGAIAAQALSYQLGVEVLAPSDILWIDFEGNIIIGPDKYTNSGKWICYKPRKEG